MKKAFTMLELVFVIVIIGILAAAIIPSTRTNPLQEAAVQLVSHIRYTQHLAMVDDKFDVNDAEWFQERWRFSFDIGSDTNNKWSYTIFTDTSKSGSADETEIAVNPLNPAKRLTGGTTGNGLIHTGDDKATAKMNIGEKYGVLDVDFSAPCRTGSASRSLGFDHLGRPIRGAIENYTSAYDSSIATNILVPSQCIISICSVNDCTVATSDQKVDIAIEAETGYAHIL